MKYGQLLSVHYDRTVTGETSPYVDGGDHEEADEGRPRVQVVLVEPMGFEPTTSTVQTSRSPN
jgi:hypothetical protein